MLINKGVCMTLFTNGYVILQVPEGFEAINAKEKFVELSLVNTSIPMTVKFSITPTISGLPDIKNSIEESIRNNQNIELNNSDFLVINDDIYYMIITSIKTKESQIRRNELLFVKDNNLYSFEFVYPYADAELDDFYLNIIRSLKIENAKYSIVDGGYIVNEN